MKTFKFFWTTHKWTGILFSVFFLVIAVTGFLLLIKKEFAWIQPPTLKGTSGNISQFKSMRELLDIVLAQQHPDFTSLDDIDRVDVRPGKRVYKVRSVRNHSEIQVDAVSGKVLNVSSRASDLIESIHDGSFVGGWFHDYCMPFVSFALLFLIFSGIWLWLEPVVKKWRKKRKREAEARSG